MDDRRSNEVEDDGQDEQHGRDGGEDGGDGPVALGRIGAPDLVDEDRDEGRRQDPAEQQVVDDVGDRVGDVVGVSRPADPQDGDGDDDPAEAAQSGERRAGREQPRAPAEG